VPLSFCLHGGFMDEAFLYTGKHELMLMEKMSLYNAYILGHIKSHLPKLEQHDKILDFGAGIGTLALNFPKEQVICLEIDPKQQIILKERGLNTVGSLDNIQPHSLSFVFSNNVLEHVPDDLGVLKTIYSKMKPGARISFYVPAFPVLFSSMDRKVGHVRRYTKGSLKTVFEAAGFKINSIFYSDFLGFFATLAFKLIGSKNGSLSENMLLFYDRIVFPISYFLDHLGASRLLGKNLVIKAQKNCNFQ
ncbi:MAG: class I SAM-dependent methyltransferase, partial [Gammaproteobacteria bacterium]